MSSSNTPVVPPVIKLTYKSNRHSHKRSYLSSVEIDTVTRMDDLGHTIQEIAAAVNRSQESIQRFIDAGCQYNWRGSDQSSDTRPPHITAPHYSERWYRQCSDGFIKAMLAEHPDYEVRSSHPGRFDAPVQRVTRLTPEAMLGEDIYEVGFGPSSPGQSLGQSRGKTTAKTLTE